MITESQMRVSDKFVYYGPATPSEHDNIRHGKEVILLSIFEQEEATALLEISYPFENNRLDDSPPKRTSPIKILLIQFGKGNEREDIYFLETTGELWIHTVSKGDEDLQVDQRGEVDELCKYEEAIKIALKRAPIDSMEWSAYDSVLQLTNSATS